MFARVCLILLTLFSLNSQAQTITIKEGSTFAIIGEPKYAAGFDHFDYANPHAPKGGTLVNATIGTFDNFNRYALRGNPGVRTEALMPGGKLQEGKAYTVIARSNLLSWNPKDTQSLDLLSYAVAE